MLYKLIWGTRVSAAAKKSEKIFADRLVLHSASGYPMRVSDSSEAGEAGQFHTTSWTLVIASARDQSEASRGAFEATDSDYLFSDCSQRAVSEFGCGKSSVIKQTLEMQSEDTSATRDPLKEACLARGVWVNS
jgi:hypothetical protein